MLMEGVRRRIAFCKATAMAIEAGTRSLFEIKLEIHLRSVGSSEVNKVQSWKRISVSLRLYRFFLKNLFQFMSQVSLSAREL